MARGSVVVGVDAKPVDSVLWAGGSFDDTFPEALNHSRLGSSMPHDGLVGHATAIGDGRGVRLLNLTDENALLILIIACGLPDDAPVWIAVDLRTDLHLPLPSVAVLGHERINLLSVVSVDHEWALPLASE